MVSGVKKSNWHDKKIRARKEWESFTEEGKPRILVGSATCGRACGSQDVIAAARAYLKKRNLKIPVTEVGCLGLCYAEVLLEVVDEKGVRVLYSKVTPESACRIIDGFLIKGKPEHELALAVMGDKKVEGINKFTELAMIKPQVRVALRNCGHINPKSIYHYIANDGYDGLVKALEIGCDNIIKEIKKAGLRGRGGAGFPTWKKWELCNNAEGDEKCLICNADEGDPGAFMDRALIEGDPHSVLEGMIIGAFAIEATGGVIYCRAEYPLAIKRLNIAIEQAREKGDILDAANIDLKSFDNKIYEMLNAGTLEPVLDTLKILREEGVWLEITNLVVPTWTDDMDMIKKMCAWLVENGFKNTPLHFSRFHPMYKLTNLPPTPLNTLKLARETAISEGMNYIYIGNAPGSGAENTYCHHCGKLLIERKGYRILRNNVNNNKCGACDDPVPGVWQ